MRWFHAVNEDRKGVISWSANVSWTVTREGGGGGYSQKNWAGVCGPLPKTPTLFMTKICSIPYPIYDLTKNSKPYLWPVSVVRYNSSLVQTNVIITVNIICEGPLLIFFSIMMRKVLLLKNIKARVQKPYPIYDQNGRNQLKSIPYLWPKRLKNHTLWGRTYLYRPYKDCNYAD